MTDKLDLVLERTIDAPIDLVWAAYTNPEHLKQWFAPRPYRDHRVRARPSARRHFPHPHGRSRRFRHRPWQRRLRA